MLSAPAITESGFRYTLLHSGVYTGKSVITAGPVGSAPLIAPLDKGHLYSWIHAYTPLCPGSCRSCRGSGRSRSIDAEQVVIRSAAGIPKKFEGTPGRSSRHSGRIPSPSTDAAGRDLRAITLGQGVKLCPCANSDIHRGIDGGSCRDCLSYDDTIFAVIVISPGREIDDQVAACKGYSLRDPDLVTESTHILASHYSSSSSSSSSFSCFLYSFMSRMVMGPRALGPPFP